MTRLFLSGIPGTGKTELAGWTRRIATELGKEVHLISLGDIMEADAKASNIETLIEASPHAGKMLRRGAIKEACLRLQKIPDDQYVIIDGTLTLASKSGVPHNTFDITDFGEFRDCGRPLDVIVTLIDDPNTIHKRLTAKGYSTTIDTVLNWTANEVNRASDFAKLYTQRQHLVLPRGYSETNLIKALFDATPTVVYSAAPITKIKSHPERKALEAEIAAFRNKLLEYAIVVVPMELADQGGTDAERAHTNHRDLHWFVPQGWTIAYYPRADVQSTGVYDEVSAAKWLGRPNVLIHPNVDMSSPFGIGNVELKFPNPAAFFEAVEQSKAMTTGPALKQFLDPANGQQRYASALAAYEKIIGQQAQ